MPTIEKKTTHFHISQPLPSSTTKTHCTSSFSSRLQAIYKAPHKLKRPPSPFHKMLVKVTFFWLPTNGSAFCCCCCCRLAVPAGKIKFSSLHLLCIENLLPTHFFQSTSFLRGASGGGDFRYLRAGHRWQHRKCVGELQASTYTYFICTRVNVVNSVLLIQLRSLFAIRPSMINDDKFYSSFV